MSSAAFASDKVHVRSELDAVDDSRCKDWH
jgi:hypothetical protein